MTNSPREPSAAKAAAKPASAPAPAWAPAGAEKKPRLITASTVHVKSELLAKPALIFNYTHQSASALVAAFDTAKAGRGGVRGILTDQEQDILRAGLVMCCAGLDAALKQSIRDCLGFLLERSAQVREGFERFIQRRISGESDVLEFAAGARFLARVLADPDPRKRLIEQYILELTGESLQSVEEIARTCGALGLDFKSLRLDVDRLKGIFAIRNKIIHELDLNLASRTRKRQVRSQADLLDNSDVILSTLAKILMSLDDGIASVQEQKS